VPGNATRSHNPMRMTTDNATASHAGIWRRSVVTASPRATRTSRRPFPTSRPAPPAAPRRPSGARTRPAAARRPRRLRGAVSAEVAILPFSWGPSRGR
jgi:hypothetical protein